MLSCCVAVAECNGDLKSFLDSISSTCAPNLTAIANQGLPKGVGRKGGIPKHKRKSAVPIQSKSIRPCLLKANTAASQLHFTTYAIGWEFQFAAHTDTLKWQSQFAALTSSWQLWVTIITAHSWHATLTTDIQKFWLSAYTSHRQCCYTKHFYSLSSQTVASSGANVPTYFYSVCQSTPTSSVGHVENPDFNFISNPLQNSVPTTNNSPSASLPGTSVPQATSHG